MIRGTKRIPLQVVQAFPVVEAIFGPLRVPVLRTPSVLDQEYGKGWRHEYRVKVNERYCATIDPGLVRRGVWPTVELQGCTGLLGGYRGAGMNASVKDVAWRFL